MNETAVVNFAKGGWYAQGQQRLWRSLDAHIGDADLRFYTDESQIENCAPHSATPYAFKPCAVMAAFKAGYRYVLWMDASLIVERSMLPIQQRLWADGYVFPLNGWTTGHWSTDACLEYFKLTRDEAFGIEHMMACFMAWDFSRPDCREFLRMWHAAALDGVSFRGAWTNKNREVSSHPEVLGHRHDQTAASLIAHQLGMVMKPLPELKYYDDPRPSAPGEEVIIRLKGGI